VIAVSIVHQRDVKILSQFLLQNNNFQNWFAVRSILTGKLMGRLALLNESVVSSIALLSGRDSCQHCASEGRANSITLCVQYLLQNNNIQNWFAVRSILTGKLTGRLALLNESRSFLNCPFEWL